MGSAKKRTGCKRTRHRRKQKGGSSIMDNIANMLGMSNGESVEKTVDNKTQNTVVIQPESSTESQSLLPQKAGKRRTKKNT